MTRYMISFDEGMMSIPADEFAEVDRVTHLVIEDAKRAGVWVFGGGLKRPDQASVVGADDEVIPGPFAGKRDHLGGFAVVDVATREEALEWGAKFARTCRCSQEVRELLPDDRV